MKKLFSLLLAISASLSLWANGNEIDGIYYILAGDSATVTFMGVDPCDDNSYSGAVTIPSAVTCSGTNYRVTSIGDDAFSYCTGLSSITIPSSVTSIGSWAFLRCSGLTSLTIPNSVTSIGYKAFYRCTGLTSITIPSSVTSIGNYAFWGCGSLASVTIGNSVTSIGDYAFSGCTSLSSITIPNSVTSIGSNAFEYCTSLSSVTIPSTVTSIGDGAFDGCWSLPAKNYIRYADTYLVEATNKNQNTYIIEEGTKWIGGSAFKGCSNLASITFPNSVTYIGSDAFSGCTSLPIEDSLRYADTYLVEAVGKSQISYIIKTGTKWIGGSVFKECGSLTSITIPNSVTSIGDYAFENCRALTSITVGSSVTSIGNYAFRSCSGLSSFTIPNSVTSIGEFAFCSCSSLASVTMGNSVVSIGGSAFEECGSLTSITIPNSVVSIGGSAFMKCGSLASVTMGNSVASIGDEAFEECYSLTEFTLPNSVTNVGWRAFYGTGLTKPVYNQHVFAYMPSRYCYGSYTIPAGIKIIAPNAFDYCRSLRALTIPNSVTTIGKQAFSSCERLSSLVIPASVTSIGDDAFAYCCGLDSIVVETGNAVYDSRNNCNALIETTSNKLIQGCKNSIIPTSVTSIGDDAFADNKGLKSITIPNSVTSIGYRAFDDCTGLTSITCFASTPPTCGISVFEDVDNSIPLYVPAASFSLYQAADVWKDFTNIQGIAASDTMLSVATVSTSVEENSVTITWPTDASASTYTIEITKNGVVFCTLTFDANGVLTNIAFAPARCGVAEQQQAEQAINGLKFTVTGLNSGTTYAYTVTSNNSSGLTLKQYTGTFTTNSATGIEEAHDNATPDAKILIDGKVYLRRGNTLYDLHGHKLN